MTLWSHAGARSGGKANLVASAMPRHWWGAAGLVVSALATGMAACATSVDATLPVRDAGTADVGEDGRDAEVSPAAHDSSSGDRGSGNVENEAGSVHDGNSGTVDGAGAVDGPGTVDDGGTLDGGGNDDADAGSPSDTGIADPDITSSVSDSGIDSSGGPDAGITETGGVGGDATACLQTIPASCPNCATQNASDKPKCQEYLACYAANGCNPTNSCGSNPDGVCGVNKIGGGSAPQSAAAQTYKCACP